MIKIPVLPALGMVIGAVVGAFAGEAIDDPQMGIMGGTARRSLRWRGRRAVQGGSVSRNWGLDLIDQGIAEVNLLASEYGNDDELDDLRQRYVALAARWPHGPNGPEHWPGRESCWMCDRELTAFVSKEAT